LAAEGYTTALASDGEEALSVVVQEKPDLIIADVMMPKISGFDMLDILRTTPETANIKVIMMTALSGDDQRARGERLGANRYLVKSQVGIEDVVNAIHEELGDRAAPAQAAAGQAPTPATPAAAPAAPGVAAAPQQVAPATISNDSPAAGQIFEVKNGLGSQGYNGTAQA
jgi:CheY-like chemotaxis protein